MCNIHASIFRARVDEGVGEPNFTRERACFRFRHEPAVGPSVHHEAAFALRAHVATDALARFENDHFTSAVAQSPRTCEPRHPRTNDDDALTHHAAITSRVIAASTA